MTGEAILANLLTEEATGLHLTEALGQGVEIVGLAIGCFLRFRRFCLEVFTRWFLMKKYLYFSSD